MTPAEIDAIKEVVEAEGMLTASEGAALLSALEEARREATDRVAAAWAEADKIGARLAAAESRADALQAELALHTEGERHAWAMCRSESARADAAWRAGVEAAAQRAEVEEELDGPMPEAVRLMAQRDPCGMLRGAVRATKKGIAAGIRALPPPSATAAPEVEVCVGCGKPWPCEHAAVKGHLDAACRACGGSGFIADGMLSERRCPSCTGRAPGPERSKP